ncbi:MAG: heparan-alpha-glucosaminide N-acetyltransferase domain-containing protein [Isosphaeraceae bacterium]
MSSSASAAAAPAMSGRIVSMDQFRGYTVAGMCVVNFLGGLAAIHPFFKHNNNYFSYADTIMPSFMFAVGFSFRLTAKKRMEQGGMSAVYRKTIVRGLGLVLFSLMMYGFGETFKKFDDYTTKSVWEFLVGLVKANLWETLGVIGVAQILVLPFIGASSRVRLLTALAFWGVHVAITYFFNWDFVYGRPNALDRLLGTEGSTAWDGGCFGLMMWGSLMLLGSLAYDATSAHRPGPASARLVGWGVVLMAVGYVLSCLSLLFVGEPVDSRRGLPESPVLPPLAKISGRPLDTMLAEPPFVQPPPPKERPINYWMMNKKIVSLPFVLSSGGFAMIVYGLFVLACDAGSLRVGLFRTFGQNALAAYLLHHLVEEQTLTLVPKDSPLWWCLVGLAFFYVVTYTFVRYLEKQGIYVKL